MRFLAIALVAALGAVAWAQYRVVAIRDRVEQLQELLMQSVTTEWKDENGVKHSVTTPRLDGESLAAWRQRHAEAVAALQDEFPPAS